MAQFAEKQSVRVSMTDQTRELLELLRKITGYSLHQLIHELAYMGAVALIERWLLVRQAHHGIRYWPGHDKYTPLERQSRAVAKLRASSWLYHLVSSPSFAVAYARRSTAVREHSRAETIDDLNLMGFKTADGKLFAKATTEKLFHPKKSPLPTIRATDLVLAVAAARLQRELTVQEERTVTKAWKATKRNRDKASSSFNFKPVRQVIDQLWRPTVSDEAR